MVTKPLKQDVKIAKERLSAWWDHEIIDKPVIAYTHRKLNFKPKAHFERWGLAKQIDAISTQLESFLNFAKKRYFGAEQIPYFWPNYGPGIMAGVLGIEPEYKNKTVWFDKPTRIDEIVEVLESAKINDNNEWYARLKRSIRSAVEFSKTNGNFSVGMTDLGGVLDILSSFLGPKNIIVNMRKKPGIIDTCRSIILEKLLKVYDDLQDIIDAANLGCNSWLNIWCPKRWYPLQCDFSAMLSPKWFKRFVLPDLKEQAEHMDYAFYHLDGPEQLKYVDDLISEPSITGIQWVPGVGEASMESDKWFPLYRKIQEAGKSLWIGSSPFSVARLYNQLDPKLLYVQTFYVSRFDAKLLLPKFAGGWGNIWKNHRFKSMENTFMIKGKAHLKIFNKYH